MDRLLQLSPVETQLSIEQRIQGVEAVCLGLFQTALFLESPSTRDAAKSIFVRANSLLGVTQVDEVRAISAAHQSAIPSPSAILFHPSFN